MSKLHGALGIVVLAAASAASAAAAAALGGGERGRRLMYSGQALWGDCSVYFLDFPGCELREPFTCASRESSGPEGANMEVELRGLPPSRSNSEVFLQFFAAYESTNPYNPIDSILPASVYANISMAYPRYDDPAFNGGNVRVDESGTAIVRFLAPAGYLIPGLSVVPLPRLHLRLCMGIGGKDVLLHPDAIVWTLDSFGWFINRKWFWWWPSSMKFLANQTMEREYTVPEPSTQLDQVLIGDAAGELKEDLDTSVLVFSPVYQCLAEGSFYDHFDRSCAEACPEGAAIFKGQCVRRRIAGGEVVALAGSWEVQLDCESGCENLTSAASHHAIRLHVAGHLEVPFQEVKVMVQMGSMVETRRLAEETVSLTLEVETQRWMEMEGQEKLNALFESTESASEVVEYPVKAISEVEVDMTQQGELDQDPFEPAYDALAPLLRDDSPAAGSGSDLPGWAIGVIAAAAAALAAGALLGLLLLFLWQRRSREESARAEAERKVADNTVAQAEGGEANNGNPTGLAPPEQSLPGSDVNATV